MALMAGWHACDGMTLCAMQQAFQRCVVAICKVGLWAADID